MRRLALTALTASLVLAVPACGGGSSGQNAVDERRVATLVADPLLVLVPPGGSVSSGPAGDTASSDLPWDEGGGRNSAGSVHQLAGTDAESAQFYVDELIEQGWTAVEAACTHLPDSGRWVVSIGARRWYDGFEGRASVSVEPDGSGSRALVAVKAPYHSEDGEQPTPTAPATDCIDGLG